MMYNVTFQRDSASNGERSFSPSPRSFCVSADRSDRSYRAVIRFQSEGKDTRTRGIYSIMRLVNLGFLDGLI